MKIVEVKHPLVKHKLGLMREHDISTKRFRELASEVGSLLTYEATSDLETEKVTIEGWNGPVQVEQIKGKKITVVPILRAGLGMMEGVLEHVPSARISVVGIYRNEETLDDAPRDKCAHFREINGIAAAFQHLQKNYNPTASSFLWPSTGKYR